MLTQDELTRFRAGESDAVRAVYREYGRLVYAVCRNQLGNPQLAEEAAQQTFLKAWRSARTVDPGRDLAPWLATIARRTAIDVHRQESRQTSSDIDDVPASHPALVQEPVAIERTYDAWQVRQALDELPADERRVVQLQHLEGLTQTAVGAATGRAGRHGQVPLVPRAQEAGRPARPPAGGVRLTPRSADRPLNGH